MYLEAADTATDFVLTGPATNLNWALQRAPQLASKVGRVFWMAGAVDVDGNIRDSDDDKAQERIVMMVEVCKWGMYASEYGCTTGFQCVCVCGYHTNMDVLLVFTVLKPIHLICQKTSA